MIDSGASNFLNLSFGTFGDFSLRTLYFIDNFSLMAVTGGFERDSTLKSEGVGWSMSWLFVITV